MLPSVDSMPELSIILPTFKERENVRAILNLLEASLSLLSYEVIFVDDDSPDGTAALVRSIAQENSRVRLIHRVHRRGLASACTEGMMSSSAPFVAVMDADMQHDEKILPEMLRLLKEGDLDLVVGSRNIAGGSMGEFKASRVRLSNVGRWASSLVCPADLSDPMSGFFILRRTFLHEVVHSLSNVGFKILLDIVASSPRPVRFAEVPYTFRTRSFGESKLDILTGVEYLQLLLDKLIGSWIPVRYLLFGFVGSLGVAVTVGVHAVLINLAGLGFEAALISASAIAIVGNFVLNNAFTFRAFKLQGRGFAVGLLLFSAVCSIGLVANWQIAGILRRVDWPSYLAATCGIMAGSLWNYWTTSIVVWGVDRRRSRRVSKLQLRAEAEIGNQKKKGLAQSA